jgi:hydroxymethylpyrimidine pyrophosphatase-like HAD family hydrolase
MSILNFGVDYDDTITADVNCFGKIFKSIQDAGHNVIIVTGRSKTGKWESEVYQTLNTLTTDYNLKEIKVVFAGSEWKRQAAVKAGFNIHIWIDNSPEYIGEQYKLNNLNIGEKDNYLSPETSGRIKKAMVETLKSAWEQKLQDLRVYPKRLPEGEEKDKLWNKINLEAQDLINDLTKEL